MHKTANNNTMKNGRVDLYITGIFSSNLYADKKRFIPTGGVKYPSSKLAIKIIAKWNGSIPKYVAFKNGLEFANENVKWLYEEINKILPLVLIRHNASLLIMGKRMKIILLSFHEFLFPLTVAFWFLFA